MPVIWGLGHAACAAVTDIARLPKSKWESYSPPLRRIQLPLELGA